MLVRCQKWKKRKRFGRRKHLRAEISLRICRKRTVGALDSFGMWRDREDYEEIYHFDGSLLANLSGMNVFTSGINNLLQPSTSNQSSPQLHPSSLLFVEHFRVKAGQAALVNSNFKLPLLQKHLLCHVRWLGLVFIWKGTQTNTHAHAHTKQHVNKYPQSSYHWSTIWLVFAF